MTIDVTDLLDFYSEERLAEIWHCKSEDIIQFIQDLQSLRLACSVKGLPNQIHAIYVDDDKELIHSIAHAFNQKLPIPSSSLENGVGLHEKDIGANQYDRLARLSSNGSTKQKERKISKFIYEDVVYTQWAESLIKSYATQDAVRSDAAIYAGGITWIDKDYDERIKGAVDLESQKEFYVTGLNFDGDRFLLVEMDSNKEGVILRPILKSNFSIIPREEKERFENTHGMKIASDDRQIEPAVADTSTDPITKDLGSDLDSDDLLEWKQTAWQYGMELLDKYPESDARSYYIKGVKSIGNTVAVRMEKEKFLSSKGTPFAGSYIARHALKGIKEEWKQRQN